MSVYATAGSKLFIGGPKEQKPADFVVGDFTAEVWVEVAWIENFGAFGDTASNVPFVPVSTNRDLSIKGTRNAGTMAVVCGIDYTDAGQIAVLAAERNPSDYAFKIEFNDKPVIGASPKNSLRYFIAKVMSAAEQLDGANNIMKMNMSLGINSNTVRVNASAT